MSNLTLYNITDRFMQIMDETEKGKLTKIQEQELNKELQQELARKSANIIKYVQELKYLIKTATEEEERIYTIRKNTEKKLNDFKKYVKFNMDKLGITSITTDLGNLVIAKNPVSVEIMDTNLIPAEFKEIKCTTTVDKTAILQHFKETGEIVNGTNIITDGTNLRIK